MLGNVVQHSAQVGFRIQSVQLGGADQAVDSRRTFAAGVRARQTAFCDFQSVWSNQDNLLWFTRLARVCFASAWTRRSQELSMSMLRFDPHTLPTADGH